ncbi:MAG: DUF1553 domain-containing protein, partial [Planctomycetaceae bacterium]|nr:DUF1553 domain-containing protein [Planctomycetaceae bacterium]
LGVVVDDVDAELVGEWKKSSLSPSFVGEGYIHDDNLQKGMRQVVYRLQVPQDGDYEVRMSYTANNGRASAVPVMIEHAEGKTTVAVNETVRPRIGGLFEPLGRFRFAAGPSAVITIQTGGTDKFVIADAVQLVSVSDLTEDPLAYALKDASKEEESEPARSVAAEVSALEQQLKQLQENAPPPLPQAMSVADRETIEDCHICIRGEPENHGEQVPRGFIQVASADGPSMELSLSQSGRVELGHWLVSRANPLTARVTVNRIWAHLFGKGLVRSLDDFGTLGDLPSHPELLDSLAVDFMEQGWSVRQLIRSIVLSATYCQSSRFDSSAWSQDPENRLLWRHQQRRLQAEEIRDSLLAVSGNLDRSMGASPVVGMGESAVANNSGEDTGTRQSARTERRTIYLPVIRNDLPDFLTVFDFADPDVCTVQRNETIVPAQALWMMNSPLIRALATQIVQEQVVKGTQAPEDRIRQLYQRILGRTALPEETADALQFVGADSGDESTTNERWAQLCHVLLASSEFRFVD